MSGPITRYAFHLDAAGCSGCKACQVACKDRNGLEVGRLFRRVYEVSGGSWQADGAAWRTDAFAYNLSIACNHCERPICVEVCPTGAMQRDESGVVWVDPERCVGCRYCAWACPYGAPQYDAASGTMSKCDFCREELGQGRSPVCVAACPLRVLNIIDRDEMDGVADAGIFPLPDTSLTDPALKVVLPRASLNGCARTGRLANVDEIGATREDEGALVWFTVLFQAAVGLHIGLALAGLFWLGELRLARGLFGTVLLPMELVSLAATLTSGGSLAASLLHLGRPMRAWRALENWRTSPLSREVWLASGFFGLSLFSIGVGVMLESLPVLFVVGWAWFVAMFGLAAVASMARVYNLRTIPAWAKCQPARLFMETVIALGGLGTAALLALVHGLTTGPSAWLQQAAQAGALLGLLAMSAILFQEARRQNGQALLAGLHHRPSAIQAAEQIWSRIIHRHFAAWACAVLGFAGVSSGPSGWPALMFVLAWVFTVWAELLRRAAFYLTRQI